jgi:hypothetical protein
MPLLSNLAVSTTNNVNLMVSTPSRWPRPQTRVSRGSVKAKGMVNALTRIGPDLVPLWTNLIRPSGSNN